MNVLHIPQPIQLNIVIKSYFFSIETDLIDSCQFYTDFIRQEFAQLIFLGLMTHVQYSLVVGLNSVYAST